VWVCDTAVSAVLDDSHSSQAMLLASLIANKGDFRVWGTCVYLCLSSTSPCLERKQFLALSPYWVTVQAAVAFSPFLLPLHRLKANSRDSGTHNKE
jgi:hypothetical protein